MVGTDFHWCFSLKTRTTDVHGAGHAVRGETKRLNLKVFGEVLYVQKGGHVPDTELLRLSFILNSCSPARVFVCFSTVKERNWEPVYNS